MSTSSAYSSNKLKQVLKNSTQHFIIKSFLTAAFEYDKKIVEYHLYWINLNKGIYEEFPLYKLLCFKKMNAKEIKFFKQTEDTYELRISSEDGKVWDHKELKFDKEQVKVTYKDFL